MPWKWQFVKAPNVWSAKCLGAKCPRPPNIRAPNVWGGKCPYRLLSGAPIVPGAKFPGAKCPNANCRARIGGRQMYDNRPICINPHDNFRLYATQINSLALHLLEIIAIVPQKKCVPLRFLVGIFSEYRYFHLRA